MKIISQFDEIIAGFKYGFMVVRLCKDLLIFQFKWPRFDDRFVCCIIIFICRIKVVVPTY